MKCLMILLTVSSLYAYCSYKNFSYDYIPNGSNFKVCVYDGGWSINTSSYSLCPNFIQVDEWTGRRCD